MKASEVAAKTIKPDGLALTLQNGLGNIEILSEYVGRDRAMQGVTMQGATLLGPGRIRTSGRGATHLGYVPIELAAPRDFAVGHRAYEISALFNSAGLEVARHRRHRWVGVGQGDHQRGDQSADGDPARAQRRARRERRNDRVDEGRRLGSRCHCSSAKASRCRFPIRSSA